MDLGVWPLICLSVLRGVASCMLTGSQGCGLLYADRDSGGVASCMLLRGLHSYTHSQL